MNNMMRIITLVLGLITTNTLLGMGSSPQEKELRKYIREHSPEYMLKAQIATVKTTVGISMSVDQYDRTLLHCAAQNLNLPAIQILKDQHGLDPKARDSGGWLPLRYAQVAGWPGHDDLKQVVCNALRVN
jgi:hypothetical protein